MEYLGSWVELKALKPNSKKKPAEELCDADYLADRWFPDPLSESLILRWFSDASGWKSFLVGGRMQSMLFAFLRRIGLPKYEMPKSISEFTRWASHSLALEIPPYMHSIAYGQPSATHISPESWLRVYSGKRVQKFDSSITPSDVNIRKKITTRSGGLVPLSEQFNYVESITQIAFSDAAKEKKKEEIRSRLSSDDNEPPSLVSWLIGMFILKLLEHGGQEKKNLELSSIKRYIGSIKAPLLNAFVDVDATELSESSWLSLLQRSIELGKRDQMAANRVAEFAQFARSLDGIPEFDVNELEGVSINKRVNANLVTHHEFELALQLIPYGRRMLRMQRLAGALGFHLGLRSGETIHALLKDIAGEAYPELLVRTNKYNRTKNRTSRRLPLHSLLPGKLFHEFMLFYHERMSEEKGKMGNKLLFCHPGNPTKPLSYDELISPTVQALKQVTGDQTLVYHNLRHSFANNTLIRLLLPEFPRIKCESIHMFKHEAFSMKSCIQLRQRLLPGTAKDVRTSVRDALYQLAMFMGHKSPSTTVTSYLHMFDWIIHRCLTDERVQLDDSVVRSILGIEGKYWFEMRKRMGAKKRSERMITDELMEHIRSKHIGHFDNLAKRHELNGIKFNVSSGYRDLVPTDLVQLLSMLFNSSHTIEEISEIMNVSPDDIIQQKANAERLVDGEIFDEA